MLAPVSVHEPSSSSPLVSIREAKKKPNQLSRTRKRIVWLSFQNSDEFVNGFTHSTGFRWSTSITIWTESPPGPFDSVTTVWTMAS
jgi:hypothetical protein